MATTPVPSMTPIPPFPALSDRAAGTYNAIAFTFGSFMGSTFNGQFIAVANSAYANAVDAESNAAIAQAAANTAGAIKWISGTTYAIGDARWSPADLQTYRRRTAGAGTTDPSADTTNWARVTYRAAPTAITVRSTSGTTVAPAAVTGVKITAVGGGGGGVSTNAFQFGGGGGSAVVKTMACTAGDSFVCTIGSYGAQNAAGGNTTITGAATITAAGGGFGTGTYCNSAAASSGGDLVIPGDLGHGGNNSSMEGCGGRSALGNGRMNSAGAAGFGGGACSGATGIGGGGVVIFEWIY